MILMNNNAIVVMKVTALVNIMCKSQRNNSSRFNTKNTLIKKKKNEKIKKIRGNKKNKTT